MISKEHQYILSLVQKWFNASQQVEHYRQEVEDGPTAVELLLLKREWKGQIVLDVGCGAGRVSFFLAEKGAMVTGMDLSEELIQIAEGMALRKGIEIKFQHVEAMQLPFSEESFDHILLFKVLCYIPTKELRAAYLSRLYQLLRKGGSLFITQNIVPEEFMSEARDEFFNLHPAATFSILEEGDSFPRGVGYVRWFTEEELLEELRESPFRIAYHEDDANYNGSGFIKIIQLVKD